MAELIFEIDGCSVECSRGKTILEAADSAGIYIPRLCYHPDLPPASEVTWADFIYRADVKIAGEKPGAVSGEEAHCNLCLVEIDGHPEPVNSCITPVEEGMVVRTDTEKVKQRRKEALSEILADHPHACLTCAQKEGCSRTECSLNVPVDERCCILLGHCELEKIADYIGIPPDAPKYKPRHYPIVKSDPLFDRDFNLCIGCLRCVRVCNDIRGVKALGAVWKDGRSWVGTVGSAELKEAHCRFCGACVEVCPTGALLDKEGVPAIRRDAPVPCVGDCPAGIDIPRYVRLIALGRNLEALQLIRSRVPFPGILGYVCFHPCEDVCRRGEIDQAVAICALKRFVADHAADEDLWVDEKQPDTGKRIAVIGSGPAGLTAAYYLGALGHEVDLYDNTDKPGGMLRHGIPDYRLPPKILDRELKILDKMGINFIMNQRIDNEFGIPELKARGLDAILIAAGASASKKLPVANSDLEGIFYGLEFLRSAKISHQPRLAGRAVVIGGGNVAVDAAMTALRLGADDVHLVCLESRDEMPAHEWEIAQAIEEGVEIHPSWGPREFKSQDNRVSGVGLIRCTRVFDEQKRFDPQYDENEAEYIDADFVIITIGQEVDRGLYEHIGSLPGGSGQPLKIDEDFAIGIDGVFAAGDVVRGPSSVVEAIADGRKAAEAIDRYLGGKGIIETAPEFGGLDDPHMGPPGDSFDRPGLKLNVADPAQRKTGFGLIEETLQEPAARSEAERCLQCHLRRLISPVILPPAPWLSLDKEAVESVPETDGVFRLLDSGKKVLRISGTANLRQGLSECLENPGDAAYFMYEEDPMYTKRESELIQQYLQEHGKLPVGNDMEDDLF
jgi:formate dehydrogenase beta subunit